MLRRDPAWRAGSGGLSEAAMTALSHLAGRCQGSAPLGRIGHGDIAGKPGIGGFEGNCIRFATADPQGNGGQAPDAGWVRAQAWADR